MLLSTETYNLFSKPIWIGFWIGRHSALRAKWMQRARIESSPALRKQYVSYARDNGRELAKRIKELRKWNEVNICHTNQEIGLSCKQSQVEPRDSNPETKSSSVEG